MPTVLSYEDVEALGTLAYQGGRMAGRAQRQREDLQYLQGVETSRNRTAAQLQQIEARERQAEADRALQRELAGDQQAFRRQQLASQEARTQAQLQQAMAEAGLDYRQDQMAQQARLDRDEQMHQRELEKIRLRNQLKGAATTDDDQPRYAISGVPDRNHARQEVQQFGHLIPFRTGQAISAGHASRQQQEMSEIAENLSQLPTDQLRKFVSSKPNDPWAGYATAVIQARDAQRVKQRTPGANPEAGTDIGRRRPSQQSLQDGPGLASPLSDLTIDELNRLANDPELAKQYLSQ